MSWLRLDYCVELYIDTLNLPKYMDKYRKSGQLVFKSIKEIMPYDLGEEILPYSDLFRYKLLYKYGGVWADMDMVLLKRLPKDPELSFVLGQAIHLSIQDRIQDMVNERKQRQEEENEEVPLPKQYPKILFSKITEIYQYCLDEDSDDLTTDETVLALEHYSGARGEQNLFFVDFS